jgi:hypothetical protein
MPAIAESEQTLSRRVLVSALALFVVTSIHHGYGAYVYNSPWRLHAVLVSGVTVLVLAGLQTAFRSSSRTLIGKTARGAFVVVGTVVLFLGFGVFEGGYNHVVKDILYFSNVSPELLRRLYPSSLYELPNNVLFEVTGVLQIVPGIAIGYYLYRLVRAVPHRTAASIVASNAANVI